MESEESHVFGLSGDDAIDDAVDEDRKELFSHLRALIGTIKLFGEEDGFFKMPGRDEGVGEVGTEGDDDEALMALIRAEAPDGRSLGGGPSLPQHKARGAA